ncbi:hypothetical protein AALO_G00087920, partial [Alosa alosa]
LHAFGPCLFASVTSRFRTDLTRSCCDARWCGCIETTGARVRAHPMRASLPSRCRLYRASGYDVTEKGHRIAWVFLCTFSQNKGEIYVFSHLINALRI